MKAYQKQGYWRLVGRQFKKNRLAVCGMVFVGLMFVVALGAPFLAHERPIYARVDVPGDPPYVPSPSGGSGMTIEAPPAPGT